MAKIVYAILTAFAIELALYLFGGTSGSTSSLFGLLLDPSGIATDPLYLIIVGALAAIGFSTIIIGTFYNINIFGIYAAVAAVLLSFALTLAHLWTFLNGELPILQVGDSSIIATIIVAPLLIAYLIITLNYVRSND